MMSNTTQQCRRCSDCVGMEHHWLPNPEFGDCDAPEEMQDVGYVCKHCPALGIECATCYGSGWIVADGWREDCDACNGEGVRLTSGL